MGTSSDFRDLKDLLEIYGDPKANKLPLKTHESELQRKQCVTSSQYQEEASDGELWGLTYWGFQVCDSYFSPLSRYLALRVAFESSN